jgi:hypothetical protein
VGTATERGGKVGEAMPEGGNGEDRGPEGRRVTCPGQSPGDTDNTDSSGLISL